MKRFLVAACVVSASSACISAVESAPSMPGTSEGSTDSAIVNGRRSPTVVSLTSAQVMAIGAVMQRSGSWVSNACTGTLVAPRVVLTAAHCVLDEGGDVIPASALAFATGEDSARPAQLLNVNAVHVHPSYDPEGFSAEGDVAILELADNVRGATPLPVQCTAPTRSQVVGRSMQAVGYGDTDSNGSNNTRRYWAAETVTSITSHDLVVDGGGRAGVCSGDSGGPALMNVGGTVRIQGVLSWGDAECGNTDHYALAAPLCGFLSTWLEGAVDTPSSSTVTVEGVTFSATQQAATLSLVNTAALEELDVDAGLDSRAARAIADARPIASLGALAALPYVGATALTRLRDHAE